MAPSTAATTALRFARTRAAALGATLAVASCGSQRANHRPAAVVRPRASATPVTARPSATDERLARLRNVVDQYEHTTSALGADSPDLADRLMALATALHALADAESAAAQTLQTRWASAPPDERAALEHARRDAAARADQHRARLVQVLERLDAERPADARADEVLGHLADAYRERGEMDRAQAAYRALLDRYPQSRAVAQAYLFLADRARDQRAMGSARDLYERAISARPAENSVRGYAMYQQAWVLYDLRRFNDSLQMFFRVIDDGRLHTYEPAAARLMRAARTELVTAYGSIYGVARPRGAEEALDTFRRYAADDDGAYVMLERLGQLYQARGQGPDAVAVYQELIARRPASPRQGHWRAQAARAIAGGPPSSSAPVPAGWPSVRLEFPLEWPAVPSR